MPGEKGQSSAPFGIHCRDAYLSVEAESEAEARDEVFGRDEETFDWENHDLKIESVDEQEPYDEPSH